MYLSHYKSPLKKKTKQKNYHNSNLFGVLHTTAPSQTTQISPFSVKRLNMCVSVDPLLQTFSQTERTVNLFRWQNSRYDERFCVNTEFVAVSCTMKIIVSDDACYRVRGPDPMFENTRGQAPPLTDRHNTKTFTIQS